MPTHVGHIRTRTVERTGSFAQGYFTQRSSVSMGGVHIGYIESINMVGKGSAFVWTATNTEGGVVARIEGSRQRSNALAALRDHALESIQ